jgi:hypothetical protein
MRRIRAPRAPRKIDDHVRTLGRRQQEATDSDRSRQEALIGVDLNDRPSIGKARGWGRDAGPAEVICRKARTTSIGKLERGRDTAMHTHVWVVVMLAVASFCGLHATVWSALGPSA